MFQGQENNLSLKSTSFCQQVFDLNLADSAQNPTIRFPRYILLFSFSLGISQMYCCFGLCLLLLLLSSWEFFTALADGLSLELSDSKSPQVSRRHTFSIFLSFENIFFSTQSSLCYFFTFFQKTGYYPSSSHNGSWSPVVCFGKHSCEQQQVRQESMFSSRQCFYSCWVITIYVDCCYFSYISFFRFIFIFNFILSLISFYVLPVNNDILSLVKWAGNSALTQ